MYENAGAYAPFQRDTSKPAPMPAAVRVQLRALVRAIRGRRD